MALHFKVGWFINRFANSFASIRIDVGHQSVRSVIPLFPLQMRPSPPSQGPSAAPLSTSIMFPPPRSAVDSVHFHFDASNLLNIDLCFLFACFFFSPPARTSWKECLIIPYYRDSFPNLYRPICHIIYVHAVVQIYPFSTLYMWAFLFALAL